MKLKGLLRAVIILFVLALNFGCDQATKNMMRRHIDPFHQYSFFNGHVTLLHVENKGAFLSLGDSLGGPLRFTLLTLLPVFMLAGALVYIILKDKFSYLALTGIVFVIGGGMGNLYDRIVHGSVTDFMHLKFGVFQTGIFNMADVSIMVGMGMLLLDALLGSRNKQAERR